MSADHVAPLDQLDDYGRIPNADSARTYTLGVDLLGRAKRGGSIELQRDLRRLRRAVTALGEATRSALVDAAEGKGARAEESAARIQADRRIDGAWRSVEQRLSPWLALDPSKQPEGARALYELLFAGGLGFVNEPYRSEWAESDRRIAALREAGHEKRLRRLVDDAFVDELLAAHEQYTRALGIGAAGSKPDDRPLGLDTALNEARSALRKYARQVVAHVDDDDPESVREAQTALAPIAQLRAELRGRAKGQRDAASPNGDEETKPS